MCGMCGGAKCDRLNDTDWGKDKQRMDYLSRVDPIKETLDGECQGLLHLCRGV